MKITDWTLYIPDKNFHVLVELHTDMGHSGWGAAYSQTVQVLGALGWLKKFVIGQSPLEIERVTENLHQITFWLGRGGAMTHAISAINTAMWDAAGKILGQPVHVLLGGKTRDAVPAYGSVLFHPVDTLPDRIAAMKAGGFLAIKLGWDPFGKGSIVDDERLVSVTRREAGDDVTLLIDAGGSYPYWPLRFKDALQRAKMLSDYGVYWLEEPLAPDDLEGYARLTDASPVKIAHGEVLSRRQSFVPYFDRRAMDIVQPDVAKVGGLSEMRRIAWMAESKGIELVPHGWNTAIGVAADLHLTSTLSSRTFVEFNFGNPLVEELTETPFRLGADGCLQVPDAPGLGIAIDRDKLRQFEQSNYASPSWTWDERKEFEAP
jgi:L-alanine-DL-glutamate epimerase-like enolase superfamily enzyme